MYDVIALGLTTIDYLSLVPRFPIPDEKLDALDFDIQGGGNAANTAVTLARLGAKVALISKIGPDQIGKILLKDFKKEKVDTKYLQIAKGESRSPFSFIMADPRTDNRTIIQWHELKDLDPRTLPKNILNQTKLLFLDSRHPQAALKMAKLAKLKKIPIILGPERINPTIKKLIKLSDVLIVPEDFPKQYFGKSNGPHTVVVTLGKKGSVLKTKNELLKSPALKVKAIDTTGAGDAFTGAFIYGMLKNWDSKKILKFANKVAGLKCREIGSRKGLPRLSDLS